MKPQTSIKLHPTRSLEQKNASVRILINTIGMTKKNQYLILIIRVNIQFFYIFYPNRP